MGMSNWEMWCLAWDPTPVVDRLFEIHDNWRDFHGRNSEDAGAHYRWLMGQKVPVYMNDVEADIPTSVRYPIEDVAAIVGKTRNGDAYLESSIAFMMALAIVEGWKEPENMRIGIWGVDLDVGTEYSYQRPNMEYLIGLARGRGIKVFIPERSSLLTHAKGKAYGKYTPLEGGTARLVNVNGEMVEMSNAQADAYEQTRKAA
jgi:hypothetical protein